MSKPGEQKRKPENNPLFAVSRPTTTPLSKEQVQDMFAPEVVEDEETVTTQTPIQHIARQEPSSLPVIPSDPEPIVQHRRRRRVKFHDQYEPFASYIDKRLKTPFEALVDIVGPNITAVFNEAVYDIIIKYQSALEDDGIDVGVVPKYPQR